MLTCQTCNNEYNIGEMADWTICYNCMRNEKMSMDYIYVDSLGIGWTEHDLRDAGGVREVEKLCTASKPTNP